MPKKYDCAVLVHWEEWPSSGYVLLQQIMGGFDRRSKKRKNPTHPARIDTRGSLAYGLSSLSRIQISAQSFWVRNPSPEYRTGAHLLEGLEGLPLKRAPPPNPNTPYRRSSQDRARATGPPPSTLIRGKRQGWRRRGGNTRCDLTYVNDTCILFEGNCPRLNAPRPYG